MRWLGGSVRRRPSTAAELRRSTAQLSKKMTLRAVRVCQVRSTRIIYLSVAEDLEAVSVRSKTRPSYTCELKNELLIVLVEPRICHPRHAHRCLVSAAKAQPQQSDRVTVYANSVTHRKERSVICFTCGMYDTTTYQIRSRGAHTHTHNARKRVVESHPAVAARVRAGLWYIRTP